MLKARMGEAGKRVPTGILPDWVLWLASYFDSSLKQIVPMLGTVPQCSNEKAKCVPLILHPNPYPGFDPVSHKRWLPSALGVPRLWLCHRVSAGACSAGSRGPVRIQLWQPRRACWSWDC